VTTVLEWVSIALACVAGLACLGFVGVVLVGILASAYAAAAVDRDDG